MSFLVITGNGLSQKMGFSSEVAVYLERNGTLNQYRCAYDALLKMLVKQLSTDCSSMTEGQKEQINVF
ncbi:MAG: hypothetical protein ABJN95_18160 [Maribacter sp.]|uniref:hypothetical protein n=1 Tax=Maribacter sp. TaxID=1897614 RepID=UPI003297DC47